NEEDDEDEDEYEEQQGEALKSVLDNADKRQARLGLLLEAMDRDQMSRYEYFRRANVNKTGVKRLVNSVLGQSVSPNIAIAVAGVSKLFLGELVERARQVQKRELAISIGEAAAEQLGPLQPHHVREAWRLYKIEKGTIPQAMWR
ncbi:hypothetical protein CANCADRAFT_20028, partial [Tortispora caseinolytica NRRL Y-17796]